jgi:hypothetical protein
LQTWRPRGLPLSQVWLQGLEAGRQGFAGAAPGFCERGFCERWEPGHAETPRLRAPPSFAPSHHRRRHSQTCVYASHSPPPASLAPPAAPAPPAHTSQHKPQPRFIPNVALSLTPRPRLDEAPQNTCATLTLHPHITTQTQTINQPTSKVLLPPLKPTQSAPCPEFSPQTHPQEAPRALHHRHHGQHQRHAAPQAAAAAAAVARLISGRRRRGRVRAEARAWLRPRVKQLQGGFGGGCSCWR